VRVRDQIIGGNEAGSETPETPIKLRKRKLALPHARATGLATTPRLLALVRMWEERKCSGRVGVTVDNY